MTTQRLVLLTVLISTVPLAAQEQDFLPLEVGNQWLYVRETVDGNYIGDYQADTCLVEVRARDIRRRDEGIDFSPALVLGLPFYYAGNPCWQVSPPPGASAALSMHKDASGSLWWRPPEPLPPPDTAAFLVEHPSWTASRLAEGLQPFLRDGLVIYFPFGLQRPADDPVGAWYFWTYLLRSAGVTARAYVPEVPPYAFSDGARAVFETDSLGEVQSMIVFEDGIGVTFVDGFNLFGPPSQLNQTRLLWAQIDGIEFGQRPTVVDNRSWGAMKSARGWAAPARRRSR